jgi:general stress protein CsbA
VNEKLALFLIIIIAIASLFAGSDDTAWIAFLIFFGGTLGGLLLSMVKFRPKRKRKDFEKVKDYYE